jgi:DNA-binding MltR family transcriptional regulator
MTENESVNEYETIEYLHQLDFAELRTESDRGIVLIFSEYINELLRRILAFEAYKKTKSRSVVDDLFNDSRPLGTFSSRLLSAHAFGVINKKPYLTISIMRKIRNVFAHENTLIDLSSPKLKNLISELRNLLINDWVHEANPGSKLLREKYAQETSRQIFAITASTIIAFLYGVRNAKLEQHLGEKIEEKDNPGLENFWMNI